MTMAFSTRRENHRNHAPGGCELAELLSETLRRDRTIQVSSNHELSDSTCSTPAVNVINTDPPCIVVVRINQQRRGGAI